MAQEQRFRSGVGWCFGVAVLAVCAAVALSQSNGLNLTSLVVLGIALVWILWLGSTTVYVVDDRGLLVRSGPMRRWVDAKLVECIRPTTTLLAAPALSGSRLEISGGFGVVVISPQDQAGFVRALKQVAPQLRLEGGLDVPNAG